MDSYITFSEARLRMGEFLSYLQSQGYKESTQEFFEENIDFFLNSAEREEQQLTEEYIYEFVDQRYDRVCQRSRYNSMLGSCRRFFSFLCNGDFSGVKPKEQPASLSQELEAPIKAFVSQLATKNCESTLLRKQKELTSFARYLSDHGITSFTYLDVANLLAYLQASTPEARAYIRAFLRYLFLAQFIERDLSVLINIPKRPRKLPTVYSEEEINAILETFDGDDLITIRKQMSTSCLREIFKKYFAIAKEQHPECFQGEYSPHSMRHTTATHMLEAGVPLLIIKNFLGHSSLETTQVYAKVTEQHFNTRISKWNTQWLHVTATTHEEENCPAFLR